MKYIIAIILVVSIYAVASFFGPAWSLAYMAALCVAAIFYIQSERSVSKKNEKTNDRPIPGVDCAICGEVMSCSEILEDKIICSECTKILKLPENADNIKK